MAKKSGVKFQLGLVTTVCLLLSVSAFYIVAGHARQFLKPILRYELTVSVRQGSRTMIGRGVWSTSVSPGGLDARYAHNLSGDAIPIRLSNSTDLVVVPGGITGNNSEALMLPFRVFLPTDEWSERGRIAATRRLSTQIGRTGAASCDYNRSEDRTPKAPTCLLIAIARRAGASFRMQMVSPGQLKQAFGSDVDITSVSIKITDKPVTRQRWVDEYGSHLLSPSGRLVNYVNPSVRVMADAIPTVRF